MSKLPELIRKHEQDLRASWLEQMSTATRRGDLMKDSEVKQQIHDFLEGMVEGLRAGAATDLDAPSWEKPKELMRTISASRALQGFSTSETASFILSLKQPLFNVIRKEMSGNPDEMFKEIWNATLLVDKFALFTTEAFMAAREQLIKRQQQELLELSTPVVKLWEGILALPIIGTLDSARTQVVMESLLQTVVQTNSKFAIIDITGVPTVDTLVAQHLLKTITAARLMGAECIISGIRPQIAQTIVHLGIDLAQVTTKAKLADAFAVCLQRSGRAVVKVGAQAKPAEVAPAANGKAE
ncbi:MAG TPA: STAS domain-containing protein [Candidatus Angelobacter sp.]|nr:STAS domain-containing protein [Candidatus Angelobacter sp.]